MLPKGGIQEIMKQAQKLQKEVERAKEELEHETVEASAGGGMVTVIVTGKKTIKSLKISPEILSEDKEMLEDLIIAAVNQGLKKADELVQERLGVLTGGLRNIPGLEL
ncbi:MAG: YbaB/EbfC family nucleoid-associated protein [Candidatus Marinimicrobia bacterium]|nr:YbaB/EbfC family nucleoid-associated protein [Candidatus Neomarinimicrobiota bacterium]MDD5581925.1 YbaB/EbfC family nucleoid-associated protein [Candidatus Neomarinimicrobiota bacterium]